MEVPGPFLITCPHCHMKAWPTSSAWNDQSRRSNACINQEEARQAGSTESSGEAVSVWCWKRKDLKPGQSVHCPCVALPQLNPKYWLSVPHLHQDCGLQLWLSTNYAAHLEMYFMEKKNKVGSFLSSIQYNSGRLVLCAFNDQNLKNFLCIGWNLPSPTFLLQSSLPSISALCTLCPVWRFSIWSHTLCFQFQFHSLPACLENSWHFSSLLFLFTVK